ncbi:hypothetical protein M0R04_05385 [Candidatus Dojkabacteria bacterium]|jgi:hypothetical protein|nr:hypothetical protein [Candidatus Dojkabacteria bacterium]
MKKLLYIILTILMLTTSAYGAININAQWSYYTAPSFPAVSGFRIYQEGVFVCETKVPTATSMDCTVTITKSTTNFTMTATFVDNTESPFSEVFPFVYKPIILAPTSLEIKLK